MDDINGNELTLGKRVIGYCLDGFLVEGELIETHRFNSDGGLRMKPLFVVKFEMEDPSDTSDDYTNTDNYQIEGADSIMVHPLQP